MPRFFSAIATAISFLTRTIMPPVIMRDSSSSCLGSQRSCISQPESAVSCINALRTSHDTLTTCLFDSRLSRGFLSLHISDLLFLATIFFTFSEVAASARCFKGLRLKPVATDALIGCRCQMSGDYVAGRHRHLCIYGSFEQAQVLIWFFWAPQGPSVLGRAVFPRPCFCGGVEAERG